MSARLSGFATRGFIVASVAAFALSGYGCSNDSSSIATRFTASATPSSAGLIKLLPNTSVGPRVAVSAVIYGPASLDMYSFDFDLEIGNPAVLAFVSGSAVAGNALSGTGGQSVVATATKSVANPSHVVVSVHKTGGGSGDDVLGNSAIVVTLAFDALTAGSSTLAIATSPAPAATNSANAAIGAITFDSASATVTGYLSGGGPY